MYTLGMRMVAICRAPNGLADRYLLHDSRGRGGDVAVHSGVLDTALVSYNFYVHRLLVIIPASVKGRHVPQRRAGHVHGRDMHGAKRA